MKNYFRFEYILSNSVRFGLNFFIEILIEFNTFQLRNLWLDQYLSQFLFVLFVFHGITTDTVLNLKSF